MFSSFPWLGLAAAAVSAGAFGTVHADAIQITTTTTSAPAPAQAALPCSATSPHFRVELGGRTVPIIVTHFHNNVAGELVMELATGTGIVIANPALVRSIDPTCEAPVPDYPDNADGGTFSSGGCFEPRQFAANWSAAPILSNQIVTRGFSVYVERENDAAAATPPDIRLAFGTALTMWMAALDHIKSTLSPDLQAYLTKIKGCSPGGYCLLTPPQVVEVRCPSSALFIVRWVTTASEVAFLDTDVAKARMQGRTVLINADTHVFRSDLAMQQIKEVSTINLITVMAHELGHSFGLIHSKQVPSIMAPSLSLLARQPTDDDAAAFAGLLEQSIQGGPAGEFNASDCAGLEDDFADAPASNVH